MIDLNGETKASGLDAISRKSRGFIRWVMVFFLICGALTLVCCGSSNVENDDGDSGGDTETYIISGTVSGDVASGVTITLSGADSSGDYSFTVESGAYAVTPSLGGYTFSPTSTSVTISDANAFDIDFTGTYSSDPENTISVTFSGGSVTVTNPLADDGVAIEVTGADVTVTSSAGISGITYSLSGTTSDGIFKIYSGSDFLLRLDGVEITDLDGPALLHRDQGR